MSIIAHDDYHGRAAESDRRAAASGHPAVKAAHASFAAAYRALIEPRQPGIPVSPVKGSDPG